MELGGLGWGAAIARRLTGHQSAVVSNGVVCQFSDLCHSVPRGMCVRVVKIRQIHNIGSQVHV